jgi:Cu-processing system ATP-binding protein
MTKGQVVSLIGPNGSGKTTLIKCILGLVNPDKGSIFFENRSIAHRNDYRSKIGYMPQIGRYPDHMKVSQLFNVIRNVRHAQQPTDDQLIEQFQLEQIFSKTMRSLSGGTRQKVSAALAFLFNPDVLILDEPTAGLDPLAAEILKEKINHEKEKGKLILITSHILSDLEDLSTDILYLQDAQIRFYRPLAELQRLTNQHRLGKAIAHVMKFGWTQYEAPDFTVAR